MNFTPVARASPSAAKCGVVPAPPEPYVTESGLARARASRSSSVRYGLSAATASAMGAKMKAVTGCRSAAGSKGSFLKMCGSSE